MLYLASKSPRRRELLLSLTDNFQTLEIDIPEVRAQGESPENYVSRMALEKAEAARTMCTDKSAAILASDTEVVRDGNILGKPLGKDDAFRMLMSLSGRSHEVLTSVVLLKETATILVSRNVLHFQKIEGDLCRRYCESGDPLDKAGSYGIQGLAASFITRLEGSYSAVMGLPLKETKTLLRSL